MSNEYNFYMDMGENATVVHGFPDLAVGRNNVSGNDVYLEVSGRGASHFTAVDANELRDAIDKAVGEREGETDWRGADRVEVNWMGERVVIGRETVGSFKGCLVGPDGDHYTDDWAARRNPKVVGKREGDELFSEQASIYQQVALHDAFDDYWGPTSTPSADDMLEKLDRLTGAPAKGSDPKPYRPIDRDRLLRHIEDVEAALARRNERHERDQERIRDLEAELSLSEAKRKIIADLDSRDLLELAWERAHVPEDGMVHEGEQLISRLHSGGLLVSSPKLSERVARSGRLLDPRVEPTKEDLYRKDLEGKGLAEWEIELLVGSAA